MCVGLAAAPVAAPALDARHRCACAHARRSLTHSQAENFAETVSADGGWKVWAVLFKDESDESAAYEKVFGDLSKKAVSVACSARDGRAVRDKTRWGGAGE